MAGEFLNRGLERLEDVLLLRNDMRDEVEPPLHGLRLREF